MSFIGIIADSKDYDFIEKEILKQSKGSNLNLIHVNEKSIQNIRNIKFETIIVCSDTDIDLHCVLQNAKYLVINTDANVDNKNINNNKLKIITYGLNRKSTVTASSINEDEVLVCLQRNIENTENNIIEVQETCVKSKNITNKKVYSLMVIFIIQQLYS